MGDWVYLRLQPYRQSSVALGQNLKLSAQFHGPFQVIARVRKVAYKPRLPPNSTIHSVFHVSLLKKKLGEQITPLGDLPLMQEEEIIIAL